MNRVIYFCSALAVATAVPSVGNADVNAMRPGLWEFAGTIKSASGEMESAMDDMRTQMANMSLEERRMMESMMGGHGIQFGIGKGGEQKLKLCITPEEASEFDVQPDPECEQEIIERSGNQLNIRFSCQGELKSDGQGTYTFRGDVEFAGTMVMNTYENGRKDTVEYSQQGKWLGEDCGNLTPKSR